MTVSLLEMFQELNSFIPCSSHFEKAKESTITTENNKEFKGLVNEWTDGDYDECPDLLIQRLVSLL
jgi:hypothetical protein